MLQVGVSTESSMSHPMWVYGAPHGRRKRRLDWGKMVYSDVWYI